MIKRIINIDKYWKVIVYYNIDYNFFNSIAKTLKEYGSPLEKINRIYINMTTTAKAFTLSNYKYKISIVGFNYHKNKYDYINSIIHESEHIKQSILYYYNIEDKGEYAAYTVAYIATKMIKNIVNLLKIL
jgi:hypothetical protein